MKNLFIILIAILSFTSCKKEVITPITPETPYICLVSSVDIESNVYVNGKKENVDSVVTKFYTDTISMETWSYKIHYYSFRIHESDNLEASVIDNYTQYANQSFQVGKYLVDNINSFEQLYFINIYNNGDGTYNTEGIWYNGFPNQSYPINSVKYQHIFN